MSDFSAFANRTIKVAFNDETRRGNLAITPGASPAEAFSAIEAAIAALFMISPVPMVGYRITYPDEDGDLCTLTEHTVSDFALLATEGIVRLTLTPTSTSGNERSTEANVGSSPMEVDAGAAGASTSSATEDAALRAKLQGLVQKVPQGMRMMLLSMAQGMDPLTLHSLLGMALTQMEQSAGQSNEIQEASEVLNTLRAMDPSAVHALALEVLRSEMDTNSQTGAADSNPLEAMLGAFLGGKGDGKGGCGGEAPAPNPMDFLGPLLASKGLGKGKGGCTAEAQGGTPPPNPMDFLGALLAGKGCGKGGGTADAQAPNPLAGLLAGLGQPGGPFVQGAANHGQQPNPMAALFGLLAAGKGAGKGFGTATAGSPSAAPSEAMAGYAPSAPPAPSAADGMPGNGDADRAAFEESVEDLLNMGLVTDRQTARELLTQHGDISSVVALLAE